MYVYRYNEHTKRYYYINISEYDESASTYDEKLHDNHIEPVHVSPLSCCYCNTTYASRSKLFEHLGFMNIAIGGRDNGIDQYNSCMGEHGVTFNKIRDRKRKKYKLTHMVKRRKTTDVDKLVEEVELISLQ